ncbi:MAG: hypothetical protein LBQ35_07630 [Spirochaetaceae bacterium]|nr:hypothetical protein [Spirochaetaceae bacterium]
MPICGVWWWHDSLISDDRYLNFAAENGVNEIYLSTGRLGGAEGAFIEKARARGISVFWLQGDYTYIEDPGEIWGILRDFKDYQASAPENRRFAGVHLDIEPQQHPEYGERRREILEDYLALIMELSADLSAECPMDIDISSWFDDRVSYRGKEVPLYEALIAEADRVFVMSYRDTAEEMFALARDEIASAEALGKPIMLGAELYSEEGDHVSYGEEGRAYMYEQLNLLRTYIDYPAIGIAIHHIKTWFDLED